MKTVVVGATGRVGAHLVGMLRRRGHNVVEASPRFGIDAVTGTGLAEALDGASVVIDVSNPPSPDEADALRFFARAGSNILMRARVAGVRHHVALSVIGVYRLASGYFRAKQLQEQLIRASGLPFTILRSTQFFEFVRDVVQEGTDREISISPAFVQPIAAEDVAIALADIAAGEARNALLEVAGAERLRLSDVAAEVATAFEDGRRIVPDVHARYFGAELGERSLLPGPNARITSQGLDDWLRDSLQPPWARASSYPGRSEPTITPRHPEA
ncbi:NAD(P)H-binding protein [Sphingomonas sp. MMSM20]|uniref:SDR family oxidoreductase n=1 Tax=Sphingomonas lycopersici TaxID=2951807 RepID=UPI002238423E|nr:NAD(P)H-binding protein [Sphingomonas lycopersici]MCW6530780.1 NAD(P)H-binding protein [Sphingomonas lycopersici]